MGHSDEQHTDPGGRTTVTPLAFMTMKSFGSSLGFAGAGVAGGASGTASPADAGASLLHSQLPIAGST